MSTDTPEIIAFSDMGLSKPLLQALDDVGYETPSPIQARTIPPLLEGRDVVGQAQTGTGKTAAFALPLLARIDLKRKDPQVQVLVLTPTRELAIQVAEAFQRYASRMKGFHVMPIYGGQDYGIQLRQLKRGVHVVVGTPGRVMDHMRRGTLNLGGLRCLVLDEADEMLRMGFIDDVDWILEQTPDQRQIALFSATMPEAIRRIARRHLNNPQEISITSRVSAAETIRQRFWAVRGASKLDGLTRILETETFDGMIVFVRTKSSTVELAERLEARGYAAVPLNGDIPQQQRERTIERFKAGKLDILVATDVAARGLDVERVSHVINFDIPNDPEPYVHRIGRTGRAGRSGEAILFVMPRERRLLFAIEKAIGKEIEQMELPSTADVNERRVERFKARITETLAGAEIGFFSKLIEQYCADSEVSAIEVAAALAKLVQGDEPLLIDHETRGRKREEFGRDEGRQRTERPRHERVSAERPRREHAPSRRAPEEGMETFRVEVGHRHGVKPGNLVGAIANEAGIDSEFIGRIDIHDDYSTIDLPSEMPKELFKALKKVWVSGQRLEISRLGEPREKATRPPGHDPHERMQRPASKGSKPTRDAKDEKGGKPAKGKPKGPRPVLGKSGAKKGKRTD